MFCTSILEGGRDGGTGYNGPGVGSACSILKAIVARNVVRILKHARVRDGIGTYTAHSARCKSLAPVRRSNMSKSKLTTYYKELTDDGSVPGTAAEESDLQNRH